MNPTVEAAWIAAGIGALGILGTSTVAVLGARSTRAATAETLKAASDDKLRDKRADAYVELLASMNIQWLRRSTMAADPDPAKIAQLPLLDEASLRTLDARLQAFATTEAYTLFQTYESTHIRAEFAWLPSLKETDWKTSAARDQLLAAVKAADQAASKLIERVRLELIGPSAPVQFWAAPEGVFGPLPGTESNA